MELKGAIFDMDGVITDTAQIHYKAWKTIFDQFLQQYAEQHQTDFSPFTIDDYIKYVDGIGRYDGIRTFLQSRKILPKEITEQKDQDLISLIAERKNELFLKLIEEEGVLVFNSSVDLIKELKANKIKTAVISASKNCHDILTKANVINLFDTIVNGKTLQELKLKGKPDPAIFIEAAKRLKIDPKNAFVVEDALSGVSAAKAANFGLIIGIDRQKKWAEFFKQQGANIVVNDLSDVTYQQIKDAFFKPLPSALNSIPTIAHLLQHKRPVIFCDFDGTLTPIVDRPELALISSEMKEIVRKISNFCEVVIISGRELSDLQERIDIDGVYYAGNHGFEIAGPKHFEIKFEQGVEFLEQIDKAYQQLTSLLAHIEGIIIEHKRLSLSIHYRLVKPDRVSEIERIILTVLNEYPNLELHTGKKVFEVRPKVNWHKGKAVTFIMEKLKVESENILPIYLGDDVSDEDAFKEIKNNGIGILVSETTRFSYATYQLKDFKEVYIFFEKLLQLLANKRDKHPRFLEWELSYSEFQPEHEGLREALCTLGNGFFATRGASEEAKADEIHYPGTYFAGVYNKLISVVAGKEVVNEDIVNMPNWLPVTFQIAEENDSWLNLLAGDILEFKQELHMHEGVLRRAIRVKDHEGRITKIKSIRFVSMANRHLAAIKFSIEPENWSGRIIIKSGLDGTVINSGIERYRELNSKHLETIKIIANEDMIGLHMRTNQSHIEIAETATHTLLKNDQPFADAETYIEKEAEAVYQYYECEVKKNETVSLEKKVALVTSRDSAINECFNDAETILNFVKTDSFHQLLTAHTHIWKNLWHRCDIELKTEDSDQQILRLHIFHLLQTVCQNSIDHDVGVPARGLHGEAYRGHIFWDELFILPFYIFYFPEVARSLLLYRYRRLDRARYLAKKAGYKGAMYPWQSGSNGDEVTQMMHLNPRSNTWIPDYSHYQKHINAAIVYNIWQYYLITNDLNFIADHGAEIVFEIARFWASITTYNSESGRYEIKGVVGPDEYHEKYSDSEFPGVKNNAYTNIMAVWSIDRALEILKLLHPSRRDELIEQLQISEEEIAVWEEITKKMKIPFHNENIISQFEGYENLPEFDWNYYFNKYGNIERLDRILKAEGDNTDNYKVSKQADVLMLFYLFTIDELSQIFEKLGYDFNKEILIKNINYYQQRTSHGSTLSKVVMASIANYVNPDDAMNYYNEVLRSDISDIQGGTTPEGIHLGAMAACINVILYRFAGVEIKNNHLHFNPNLPTRFEFLRFQLQFQSQWFTIEMTKEKFSITLHDDAKNEMMVYINNHPYHLVPNKKLSKNYQQAE